MSINLADIKKPIQSELNQFEAKFKASMKSQTPLLDRIMQYIVQRKGKQMRPVFVFLSAKLCGGITESTYNAAGMIELLHTATLVHDDVVDDAHLRRGFFSINNLWKNKIAVLVGDYLFAKGLLLSTQNQEYRILDIVSNTVREMSEGELLQIEKARKLDIEESVYYDIIRQKTASLIASACASGAASATQDEVVIENMKLMGQKIGIAFQIKDDLFDFGSNDIGKPKGIDIKERKMTLPLIFALGKAKRSEKRNIINIIKNHNEDQEKVSEVIRFVQNSGGIEYAKNAMETYKSEAIKMLSAFPDSEAKDSMGNLFEFSTGRNI